MANFNLADYETVEERIKRFYGNYPDGRIITEWIDFAQEDGKPWRYMFKTTIFLNGDDQEKNLAKATGYASETEVGRQAEWAAELAETSSIGRCLANLNMSGNKRASREEMQKVARASQTAQDSPNAVGRDWKAEIAALGTVEAARALYTEAQKAQAGQFVLKAIEAKVQTLA